MKNKDLLSCKVIMLSTEQKSKDVLDYTNQIRNPNKSNTAFEFNGYHLYLTSSREIKEGDWFIANEAPRKCTHIKEGQYPYGTADGTYHFHTWKTVIVATTDSSLGLPLIHQSFIEAYVKAEGKIDEVMIEMEEYENPVFEYKGKDDGLYVKIRQDNTVIIHRSRMYSREEMKRMYEAGRNFQLSATPTFEEMINELDL